MGVATEAFLASTSESFVTTGVARASARTSQLLDSDHARGYVGISPYLFAPR